MRNLLRLASVLALLAAIGRAPLPAAEAAPKAERFVQASDLLKIKQLDAPALSPDGKTVIYTVKSIVEKPDKQGEYSYLTQLWSASTDSQTAPRALTNATASASAPAWSPDGRRVAFVRVDKDKPQIWILPLAEGGEAFVLTKLESGATGPRWSPDGRSIAFVSNLSQTQVRHALEQARAASTQPDWTVERPQRTPGDTADWADPDKEAKKPAASTDGSRQEQREWLAQNEADGNPRVIDRLNFIGESDLEPQPSFDIVHVVEAREGAIPVAIAPDYRDAGRPAWSPDSRQLAYTRAPHTKQDPDRELSTELELSQADGSGRTTLIADPKLSLDEPLFSPDGKTIAFVAQDLTQGPNYAQAHLGFKRLGDASAPWFLDSFDRSAGRLHWTDDSQRIYFVAASHGGFPLFRVAVQPQATVEQLTPVETGIGSFDLRAGRIAYVQTEAANPFELYTADLDAKNARALTGHNRDWLRGKTLSLPEHRTVTRPDGMVIDVWLLKPAGFDPAKKYPLLVEIHGGPQAMWGPGEPSMWHEFQFFAARGYGIVYSNPRGSGGYGYDFQRANFQDWGRSPGNDVLAAADLAAHEPWVDANRQVVTGGSYGGYLTAWLITQDHRFKAAVAVRGVYDLATFFGEGNAWRLVPGDFGGYPWQKDIKAILDANSPLTFVDQITTPLLIKHGDNDLRTGFVQSEMLYKSLKVLQRPVEYARYPRGTHELSRSGEPRQRLDRLVRFEEFFRRFIGEN